jgi:L-lysine 2,3-aminomutase
MNPKYLNSIDELDNLVGLETKEREEMEIVTQTFPFRSNEYYLSLIDWKDGHDPLRRIVIPDSRELAGGGCLDPSCEKDFTKLPAFSTNIPRPACCCYQMSAAASAGSVSGNGFLSGAKGRR